jgi:hypothetical protein
MIKIMGQFVWPATSVLLLFWRATDAIYTKYPDRDMAHQLLLFLPAMFFYHESYYSPGSNFRPDMWGEWACQYPAVMWATFLLSGSSIVFLGLMKPKRIWMVVFGSLIQIGQFAALGLSAALSGGQFFMTLYQIGYFAIAYVFILVSAVRHVGDK